MTRSEFLVTPRSLVDRLGDWNDGKRWQQFFDSYWKLIHRTARKAGLTESEAQELRREGEPTRRGKTPTLLHDLPTGLYDVVAKQADWEERPDRD